ncbi:probable ABC transporter permease protein YurN [Arthrobacter sp. Hiyo6]|nr:probable ABC transporter permease protein YurN [Arthrobacter sp. Hiyo6]
MTELAPSHPATLSAGPRRPRRKSRQSLVAYALVAPFFVVFLAMFLVPLSYSGYLSMFSSRLIGGQVFVGLSNYARAFTDPLFLGGLARMALFLVVQVPIMLALSLFLALALDSARARGGKAARLAIFIPHAVPGVVATLMWGYLYGNDFGPIAQFFRAIGLGAPNLLGSDNALGSIINIVSWEYVGYNMIIMYAALQSIPSELFEAAEIDGAGRIRTAISIKIPAIRPAIFLTVIFSIIGSFQLFNEPNLLARIAPNAISDSFTPNLYAYNLAFVSEM